MRGILKCPSTRFVTVASDTKPGAQSDAASLANKDRNVGSCRQTWRARRSIWPRTRGTRRTHTSGRQRDTISSTRPSLSQSSRPKLSYRSYRSTPSMEEWGTHIQGVRSMMRDVKVIQSSTAYSVSPLLLSESAG